MERSKNLGAFVAGCLLALVLHSAAGAGTLPKAELLLQKEDPFLYGACGWCTDIFRLKENDNRKDFRQDNLDTQTGSYLIDLTGPEGTTVTLFGSQNYSLKQGYLILVKKDDRPLAVGDLEHLPPRQWVEVVTPQTGIYSVWYHPAAYFKEHIASVRWGQWWTELPPASD